MIKNRIFTFSNICYEHLFESNDIPEIELIVSIENKQYSIEIIGKVWDENHTKLIANGDILDEFLSYSNLLYNPIFHKLYYLWKTYNKNNKHTSTRLQEFALNTIKQIVKPNNHNMTDYDYLKLIHLHIDQNCEFNKTTTHWNIPKSDIKLINELLA